VTDTVGFIRDLPPELVAGFKSTLEEIRDADVLLHVVDAASPQLREQIEAVREILAELELAEKPELLVLNKCDKLGAEERAGVAKRFGGICVSALNGDGIPDMLRAAERMVFEREKR
jgi:GTPase